MRLRHLPALTLAAALPAAAAPPPDLPQPGIPPKEELAKMKVDALYQTLCAVCHGEDLAGGLGPSFLDGQWTHGASDPEIARTILKGDLDLGMLPWQGILTDEQVRSLVIFLREQEREALNRNTAFPHPKAGEITRTRHHDYTIETVVDRGLEIPWAIAFLPDGRKLVTERPGRLRILQADGTLDPRPVSGTPPVIHHGQGGLMEVAIHPDYQHNGWIYLGFADGWRDGARKNQTHTLTAVVRGRLKDHQWLDQQWIWKADHKFYTAAGVHFGTRFVFDDGFIYFVVGERGGWHEAQDLTFPNGKIHRLHDDGRVPADNPFAKTPGAVPGIWSYGHRNPQGLDRDPRDGALYATEHGPRGGDELNWIRPARNYGWPVITYGMNYNGTPITSATAKEGMEQPVTYWVPSIAACGLDFYTGDKFPKWRNDLFAGALAKQEVRRLRLENHQVVEQEIILKNLGRVRDVTDGPDGFIYVLLNGPDSIIRLIPPAQ
jgi:glucose/arabinose dehydrogenase